MIWPEQATVAAAFKGTVAEVIKTPIGNGKGVRSGKKEVYLIVSHTPPFVMCEVCNVAVSVPDPPASGAPGESRVALVAPGTKAHALFVLTWLHKFSKEHNHIIEVETTETKEEEK